MSEQTGIDPDVLAPSFTTTYRWADGDPVAAMWGWSTEFDEVQEEALDGWEPRDVIVERWERVGVEVRTLYPPVFTCSYEDDNEPCEEDAVVWQRKGEVWMQACERHRKGGGDE